MAEGAPLLRVYVGNCIEGSNPSLSAIFKGMAFRHSFKYCECEDSVRTLRFDKIAGSDFERTQCGPAGVEGRTPGIIPRPQPYLKEWLFAIVEDMGSG